MTGPITSRLLLLDKPSRIFLMVVLAATVAVPLLNLLTPADSFIHVPTYVVSLLGKYLSFAILALSVDLIPRVV